ncbi:MAG TPA: pitrilysin family protein [Candidatus Polarisedimenticolia bacterium]|nr:pitrilysin family protein [Candidatus Polarisedimenticolia bacterium]
MEGITEYRLANGLRILLFPDPSKQTTTVNITYLVGSRHEGYGETGMAHLLEHMVFKGTPNHKDIPQELTAHGSRSNGTTDYDRTNYFETVTATAEALDWALDLESDRMVNSNMAKKDLDSEFSVVRNEFEIGENYPQGVLMERVMSAAYLWHNYGKSTIGSRVDIERVPIERLRAFYKTWYQPDNAVLVVAGKIDEAGTLAKIARKFGKIPKPSRTLPATYTVEPAQDGPRSVTLRRVGDSQMAAAAYHIPAGPHPDFAAISLLRFILTDAPSGRLYKALVETKKAASVFGRAQALHDPGMLLVGATVRTESSLEEARDLLVRVTEEAATNAPTAEEVDRARDNWLKNWESTLRDSEFVAIRLSEWAAQGDWRLMFLNRDRIKAVSPDDVARVAKAYLTPENRTVGLYMPTNASQRADIPAAPDVGELVRSYKGGEALALGEAFDSSPAAIEARLIRATLPPGIKLVMLPKKTRGATVQVVMNMNLGDEKSLQGRATAASFAGAMLMRGTTKHTRQQIKDETARLKAQVFAYGYAAGAYGGVEVSRDNLPAALRLMAEILREPSFPASELELLRQERLVQLEASKSDPGQKASTRLQKHLNPWPKQDPRYEQSPEESIEAAQAVKLDEVKKFHAEFYGASSAQIAVVGDFDPDEIKALLTELFSGWKNAQPYARLVGVYQDRPAIHESIEAPDKESAEFVAGLRIDMRDDAPEFPAMVLGDFMTGGGFLNSRLAERLRQKDGISYGAGSYFYASPLDRDAYFGSSAIYAPQNAERLMTGYNEEIAKILDKGFTPEEIAEAKKGWLQEQTVSRANDRQLASTLAGNEYIGRTMAWDETVEKKVQALTSAEILAAMKKFIDPAKISTVISGDFAKAKQSGKP